MKLQTPVADLPNNVGISYNDKILMLGSCFADNIGTRLVNYGFDVLVNPFGTLYNPQSVLNSIKRMATKQFFTKDDCVEMGAGAGKFCSFSHHTSFARATEDEFLSNANSALSEAIDFFENTNKILITLGTCWCFRNIESGTIVSNCLKRPAKEFVRERMTIEEVRNTLSKIVGACQNKCEFIFTVSPIRHMADGAHGNQLSKSTLLLGIDALADFTADKNCIDYFPSYEIMMDQLRDYRFYAEDMCHPTKQAEDYIFERFIEWALPKDERPVLDQKIKEFKQRQHIKNEVKRSGTI